MSAAAPAAAGPVVDQAAANLDYMMRSRRFPVRMITIGGNLVGPYATNTTLNFIMPPVNNGWLEALDLDVSISLNVATTALTANAAFPWNLIQGITVNLDGQISYIEPYEIYLLYLTQRRLGLPVTAPLISPWGANANLSSSLGSAAGGNLPAPGGTIATGATQVIRFRLRIPMNALHPLDGSGLLPCQGTQDPVQVNVILPTALTAAANADPYNIPFSQATGTATVNAGATSQIVMYGWVRDGRTKWSPSEQLPYYPDGLPQVSYDREPDVTNLSVGSIQRGQLTKVLKIYYAWAILIDGVSSAQFASNTNINSYDLSADSTGNFKFLQYGLENIQTDLLFEDLRWRFGQDFPQGVIPIVFAPEAGLPEIGVATANDILNMTAGGWTSLYQGVNFAAQGTNGVPRIHTLIVGANDSPYIG